MVYDEDFSFLVNDKTIKIQAKDKELNLSDDDAQVQLQSLIETYVKFRHFLIVCGDLIARAKETKTFNDDMKAFVHSQMNFASLKGKESENKLINKLMDLTWLLQYSVKYHTQRRQLE